MQARRRELFTTIRTEGAILPPDLLQRVAAGDKDLGGLKPTEYHLIDGEPLNEAIVRSWNRLVGAWAAFTDARDKLPEGDLGTTVTRERWLLILFDELGYGRLQPARAVEIDGKSYAVSHAWGEHVPIHLVGNNVPLDRRSQGVAGAASMSPHGLVQELLNRSEERLWGFVSNGLTLRVLRDNSSLTRQAYVELDLASMMDGDVYADFVVLWLVCHESRVEGEKPHECWLERWSQEAVKQGTRALDGLRSGVEAAISVLGSGFLSHPSNTDLRDALRSGELDKQDYYRELLRIVYRLLFLFVAEDRGLLLDPDATQAEAERYDRFYSMRRLRRLAERRRGSKHADLYKGLRLVIESLGADDGCPALGLPALGSYLWSAGATPNLGAADLPNAALLDAIRALASLEERGVRRSVDYRNLGAEELGSVYESLLELHPDLNIDVGTFALTTAAGNERRTTGSYYTPSSLISCLLDSALEPVLDEAAAKGEQAILDLKVVDPACGSGHFLVASAHRIAKRLASARTGDDEPSPGAIRTALRDVVGHCLYGVDVNPMAAELCKVSLWMEALEPGKPLSFLDAHIKCGNSLLGTTLELVDAGIPDDAYKPITGDVTSVASSWKRRNRIEREGQLTLEDLHGDLIAGLWSEAEELETAADDTVEHTRWKELRYAELSGSEPFERAKRVADAWCTAFVQKKSAASAGVTTVSVRRIAAGSGEEEDASKEISRFAAHYAFFHWEIEFPQVFGGDVRGFDLVIGNPPWERVKFNEREYLASDYPEIAEVASANRRRRLVAALGETDQGFLEEYREAERGASADSHFLRHSGAYRLTGRGRDINTSAVFCELMTRLVRRAGRVGTIVPSGIATDENTSLFFRDLIEENRLESLFDFENRLGIFGDVDSRVKFCLLTLTGSPGSDDPVFVFFAHRVEDIEEDGRRFSLAPKDFALLNPTTRTCPVFRYSRDASLVLDIYRRAPVLINESTGVSPWLAKTRPGLFSMGNDAALFADDDSPGASSPLLEGKLAHMFDHRWATYEGSRVRDVTDEEKSDPRLVVRPRYYVPVAEVDRRLDVARRWVTGWRKYARATDERTLIPILAPRAGVGDNIVLIESALSGLDVFLPALLSNFVVDYVCRNKLGGSTMQTYIGKQLPVLAPDVLLASVDWDKSTLAEWLAPRVAELTFTSFDLLEVSEQLGCSSMPYRWDPERRSLLRAELDAAFFHLYGLAEEDVDYVMETFPIVKRHDEEKYGHYRTKAPILDVYRKMADAIATGVPFKTILDPPPADPRVAHRLERAAEPIRSRS